MARYNPFRPGSIVGPSMFSGRGMELLTFEKVLYQTKCGNPHHFTILGERGIGKSSLLFYLKLVASGKITSLDSQTYRFLVVNIELDPSNTYAEIIGKVGAEFQRQLSAHQKAMELLKSFWGFVTRWEAFGVSYKPQEKKVTPSELLEDLSYTVAQVLDKTKSEFDGLLLLIDEADKPPAESNLGQFVKLFSERLTKRGCDNFSIGLVGLPILATRLRQSHESSARIFQFVTLEPLRPAERIEVITKGLAESTEKNGYEVKITQGAEKLIADLSEGYPHFIQQFAYSAFDQDKDNEIDEVDVVSGAFEKEGGAIRQLGIRYFEGLYFDQIWSDEYREVLRAMSEHMDGWVDKRALRKETGLRESTLANALTALKKKNIIVPQRGKKGVYRLPTRSFSVWINAFTRATREKEVVKAIPSDSPSPGGSGSTTGNSE